MLVRMEQPPTGIPGAFDPTRDGINAIAAQRFLRQVRDAVAQYPTNPGIQDYTTFFPPKQAIRTWLMAQCSVFVNDARGLQLGIGREVFVPEDVFTFLSRRFELQDLQTLSDADLINLTTEMVDGHLPFAFAHSQDLLAHLNLIVLTCQRDPLLGRAWDEEETIDPKLRLVQKTAFSRLMEALPKLLQDSWAAAPRRYQAKIETPDALMQFVQEKAPYIEEILRGSAQLQLAVPAPPPRDRPKPPTSAGMMMSQQTRRPPAPVQAGPPAAAPPAAPAAAAPSQDKPPTSAPPPTFAAAPPVAPVAQPKPPAASATGGNGQHPARPNFSNYKANITCHACNQLGHFAKECKMRSAFMVAALQLQGQGEATE